MSTPVACRMARRTISQLVGSESTRTPSQSKIMWVKGAGAAAEGGTYSGDGLDFCERQGLSNSSWDQHNEQAGGGAWRPKERAKADEMAGLWLSW